MSIGKFINKFWWLLLLAIGGVALWYFKFRKKGNGSNKGNDPSGTGKQAPVTEEDLTNDPDQ